MLNAYEYIEDTREGYDKIRNAFSRVISGEGPTLIPFALRKPLPPDIGSVETVEKEIESFIADHLDYAEGGINASLEKLSRANIVGDEGPGVSDKRVGKDTLVLIRIYMNSDGIEKRETELFEILERAMRIVRVPDEKKRDVLDQLVGVLASAGRHEELETRSKPKSWSERVGRGRADEPGAGRIDVPSSPPVDDDGAPITWKTHKVRGDTAPDFVKRHYGKYLRTDGTGMTRNDINRIDVSLYRAVSNYLNKKEDSLPDDCPLPTVSEARELRLKAAFPGMSMYEIEGEVRRLRAAVR